MLSHNLNYPARNGVKPFLVQQPDSIDDTMGSRGLIMIEIVTSPVGIILNIIAYVVVKEVAHHVILT